MEEGRGLITDPPLEPGSGRVRGPSCAILGVPPEARLSDDTTKLCLVDSLAAG